MRRSPAVVAIAVLGLGLAIGVSTSVFSVLNAVTFRPTGIVDPASTARVMRAYADGSGTSWRYSEYQLLREGASSMSLDAWFSDDASIGFAPATETPTTTSVMFVTGGYLGSLSNRAARGRLLTPEDDAPGAAPVVVVSYNLWTRTLSSDPGIVGRTIWLNGLGFTVVGVAARGLPALTIAVRRSGRRLPVITSRLVAPRSTATRPSWSTSLPGWERVSSARRRRQN
jgi:hypothetical protein